MKIAKFAFSFAVATMATGAFADAADALVSFSTEKDFYADGSPVLTGEWYALVWSQDGNFEGMNLDCTPVDANDKVLLMAPLAVDGHCPFVVFEVDSAIAPTTGKYGVFMLDTRDAAKTAVAAKTAAGKPAFVNAAAAATTYSAHAATSGGVSADETVPRARVWAASRVAGGDVKVEAFEVKKASVKITVSGMLPGVQYNVKMGASPAALESYALAVPQTAENPTFVISKENAKFFQIVREPLTK